MAISGPGYLRGRMTDEVTTAVACAIGSELAARAAQGAKFVVGSDLTDGAASLKAAFSEGLLRGALDVVDLGTVAVPLVTHAQRRVGAAGAVWVSGSMLPPGSIGLAWRLADQKPTPDNMLATTARRDNCAVPSRKDRGRAAQKGIAAAVQQCEPRKLDISFDYVAHLQWTFVDDMNAAVDVVVAAEQPEWSRIARRYLQAVFPLGLFTVVERSSGGSDELSDSRRSLSDDVADGVYRHQADMGLVLGGPLDRLAVVDDQGVPFSPDETAWMLLSCYESELKGQAVVLDDRLSVRLDRAIGGWGGKAVRHCDDPSLMSESMRRNGALLGFDLDGRVFFRDLDGEDDALLAACRLIAFVGKHVSSLGSLRADCPPLPASAEVLLPLPKETAIDDLFANVARQWPERLKAKIAVGWGVVVETPQARVRLQPSRYSDALSIRFEGGPRDEVLLLADGLCWALPNELADLLAARAAALA